MSPKRLNGSGGRTRLAAAIGSLILMSAALVVAQQRSKPVATSSMRALALLEVAADGRARLVPIALKVGDKFYDASLYRASPRPLALDSGVVYQAERAGNPVGLFTVTQAQKAKDVWVGLGQWRPGGAEEPEKKVAEVRAPAKDERPVLKRHQPAASQPSPSPTATPAPTATTTPSPAAAAATPAPSPTPTASKPAPSSSAGPSSVDQDPSRPILRRGKPAARQDTDELAPFIEAKPGASHSTPGAASATAAGSTPGSATAVPAGAVEVLTAISDAAGPKPHPFVMELRSEERDKYERSLRQMAFDAIVKFAASRPANKPASVDRIEDSHFAVYDVHDNNEPDLVFTAALPERLPPGATSAFRYFVTVVARVDMYSETRQLLASVTDTGHLDAYARLELIDVVDAEGSGSGQMLFRRINDDGYDYVLYRVGSDKLWPLFEGAGSETK
jgi:hypothetical protein